MVSSSLSASVPIVWLQKWEEHQIIYFIWTNQLPVYIVYTNKLLSIYTKAWIRRDFSNSNEIRIKKSCSDFIRVEEKTTLFLFIIFYFAILLLGLWGWSISAFVHHSWSQSVTRLACTATQGCIFFLKNPKSQDQNCEKIQNCWPNFSYFLIFQFENII